jgi:hypothetical protein
MTKTLHATGAGAGNARLAVVLIPQRENTDLDCGGGARAADEASDAVDAFLDGTGVRYASRPAGNTIS